MPVPKKKDENLITQMGAQYFNEKFNNSYFLYEGKVLRVLQASPQGTRVSVEELSDRLDDDTVSDKVVSGSVFKGFKVFEYPLLGYRKFGEHKYGFASKRQTSYRGFRLEQISVTWTGCTRALIDLGVVHGGRLSDYTKAKALLKPTFDSMDDLPKLLSGKISGLVLNNNTMIEPATGKQEDWYAILYKQAQVGSINAAGNITWNDPAFANVVNL
jgi:hypothetical protein